MAKKKKDTMEFRFYELPQGEAFPCTLWRVMGEGIWT